MSKNMFNHRYTLAHKKEADTCYQHQTSGDVC